MKPVYLKMAYFGPHEHSVIDFRQLEAAPIFLIGGDTGAGKSTIFDAMTFALFGSTTNDGTTGRSAEEMRSQFAPNDQPTEVTLYFEQGRQLYRIVRRPRQWLTKQRGKGLGEKKATAKLAIVDRVGGIETTSIASKPADVGTEITALLNLTADQFKKIILLPQNDFSEFLKAKTADKETILKKIFGTQLYSSFAKALHDRFTAAKDEGQRFNDQLNFELDADTWTADEKEQLSHEAPDAKVNLLETFVTTRQATLKRATAVVAQRTEQQTVAQTQLQAARDTAKQFADLARLTQQQTTTITDQATNYQQWQRHARELTWAEPLAQTVHDQHQVVTEYDQLTTRKARTTEQVQTAEKELAAAQKVKNQLTDQQPTVDDQQRRALEITALLPNVQRAEALTTKLAQLQPTCETLQSTVTKLTQQRDQLAQQIKSKRQGQLAVADLQATRDHWLTTKERVVEILTPLANQTENLHQLMETTRKSQAIQQAQLTAKQDVQSHANATFETMRGKRRNLMIAQLQVELEDGQPCVVCGSTDHRHMHQQVAASESDLRQSMADVDQAQDDLAAANKDVEATQQQLDTLTDDLTQQTTDYQAACQTLNKQYAQLTGELDLTLPSQVDLAVIKSSFDQQLNAIAAKIKAAKHLETEIDQLTKRLDQSQEQLSRAQLDFAQQQSALKTTTTDLDQLKTQLGTHPTSSELTAEQLKLNQAVAQHQHDLEAATQTEQATAITVHGAQTRLADLTQQLTTLKNKQTDLNSALKQALDDDLAATHDQQRLESWLTEIQAGRLAELQAAIVKYDQEKQRLATEITRLNDVLVGVQAPDLDHFQAQVTLAQNNKDAAIHDQAQAETIATTAQTSLKKVQNLLKQQGDFAHTFAEISSLWTAVNGGTDRKLKLETFVVRQYLEQILDYANDHFINLLSNNRYVFQLTDEASDKRTDHGLDISVFDNETGDTRAANTLSGGETFIAALSIALSLSEVVQSTSNGVQIDALFVDEGFGSLDDETLDKAMQALETIGENRMVGVISHIESMKRTIGQQLLIKKLGDGRSTIQLISK